MPPTSARPTRASTVVAHEARTEAELEVKWIGILKNFSRYRSKEPGSYIRTIRRGIPDSLRGRVWLYILHEKSEKLDAPSKPGAKNQKVKDDRAKHYRHYLKKGPQETSGLLVCPWLPGIANPEMLGKVGAILVSYLNADSAVRFHPNMGYIASMFAAYMPDVSAWTAFVHLMMVSNHKAHDLFLKNEIGTIVLVWDYFLAQKVPRFKEQLVGFRINHEAYVVEWLQTAFLTIPFSGTLSLGIFDQFVAFGPRALIMTGIMLIKRMLPRLVVASKERVLEMLNDPARDPVFADGTEALARLAATFISKAEYRKAFTSVDPGSPVGSPRRKSSQL
jgi:hypothetical protein